jgi:filamentous hemagglutinin family protein
MKHCKLSFLIISSCWLKLALSVSVNAQITSDRTLPQNSQMTTPQDNLIQIDGGTRVGNNLFHSFKQFSLATGHTAFFNNHVEMKNILSRVTGGGRSEIDGIIKANGTANLFLINPNGVTFGNNARLDLRGSFVASTANSIKFADGFEFLASDNQTQPILTVSVPVGLGFTGIPPSIINRSVVSEGNDLVGLRVEPNKTLALVGGDVLIEGSFLTTAGGNIELLSVAGNNIVNINHVNEQLFLGYQNIKNFQDVNLSKAAFVQSDGGGDISIIGRRITLTEGSEISTLATKGKAGNLIVQASDLVKLEGDTLDAGLDFKSASFLSNFVYDEATGSESQLTIKTGSLIVSDGGQISTATFGSGQGANLSINASKFIKMTGTLAETTTPSALFTDVRDFGTGNGGNLTIETGQLTITEGAQIGSTAQNLGQGGIVNIKADSILLSGTSSLAEFRGQGRSGIFASAEPVLRDEMGEPILDENGEPFITTADAGTLNIEANELTVEDGANISADNFGTGKGANVNINVDRLILQDGGQIGAGSLLEKDFISRERGAGGTITIEASEFVEVSGSTKFNTNDIPSSLLTLAEGTGNAGNLTINTPLLSVRDGAQVTVSATGGGEAGSLTVNADSILLNDGSLEATTTTGDRGNINLNADDIILRDGSKIITNAAEEATGGNITINTDILAALENSDITANAVDGRGGNIQIDTQGIFLSPDSQITASSKFGIDGTVIITTPEVDPTAGVLELPSSPVDAESLIAKDVCRIEDGKIARGSSFIITGKGGLPPTSEDPPINSHRMVEWETVAEERGNSTVTLRQRTQTDEQGEKTYPVIQQAQGWKIAPDGTLLLTAQATTPTPQSPEGVSPHCQGNNSR